MKILYRYCLIIASVFLLFSCEKETEDVSRTTYYCELHLKGSAVETVPVGGAYTEPGWVALENDEDISTKVKVEGEVKTQTIGVYSLTYEVNNSDGYPTKVTRRVVVCDATPSPIESGGYYVAASSGRSSIGDGHPAKGAAEFSSEPSLIIYQTKPGQFFISDLFGGYYNIGRGYGTEYEINGVIAFDGTNFSLVSGNVTPWGDEHKAVRGVYNAGSKSLALQVDYSSFTFHLDIVKK